MITIEDIKDRAEGQTFDCKSVKIEPKALAVPIVAMANADGDMLAIGISDKTRKIEGVDQYPSHVNELLKVPFSLCVPSVNVKPEFIPCVDVGGKPNHVLLLHIPASATLHANQADEVFMRVGDSSRNPKIAEYLKAYKYVREFGEGVDRMCKELEAKGLKDPKYVLNAFIMKGTVYAYNVKGVSLEGNIYSDNKNVTVNSNVTIKTAKDASFGENCTVNSKTFTVNGQNCTVNFTVNGRIFTINFTINRKIFTISLTAMTKNILWDILKEPTISTETLAQKYSCTTRTVKNHLAILKKLNVLKREGGNKNGLWVLDTDSMWKKE